MATFGARSRHNLSSVHPDLRRVLERAIRTRDFAVIVGHRGEEAQNRAFAEGNSEKRWPDSRHNSFPSEAADIVPWLVGKDGVGFIPYTEDDLKAHGLLKADAKPGTRYMRYWDALAGVVLAAGEAEGVRVRWGGDWDGDGDPLDQKFNDLGHFELAR